MPSYKMTFDAIATGAVADTYKTLCAIVAADTAGHRARVMSITIGPADEAPVDKNVAVKLARVDDVSAGGAGTPGASVSGANMGKVDSESVASTITGGRAYSAEPTVYGTEPLWAGAFNARGGIIKHWDREDAPVIQRDQLIGLLAAPRDANAITLSGTIEFETF